MLFLSRKVGEKIRIGPDICVVVLDIDRGKIRLGIECPRDVPIYRQELLPIRSLDLTPVSTLPREITVPHLLSGTTQEGLARLVELLQEMADASGESYLLILEHKGSEFTTVCPYGVREKIATTQERGEATRTIRPSTPGEGGAP